MSLRAMEQYLFNLKLHVKELERESKKCSKQERIEKLKCKKDITKNKIEEGRIHAENAVRQSNQAINFLRMSARVDAVVSRIQTAIATSKVTSSMAGVCKSMEHAMKSLDLERIANWMDKFETQFENMDVQTSFTESTMGQSTTTSVPQESVNKLMQSVAEEAGLDLKLDLPGSSGSLPTPSTSKKEPEEDDLTARLAKLRM